MSEVPLREALEGLRGWLSRHLERLVHVSVKDERGHIVNGFAAAQIPDWDAKQRIAEIDETLAAYPVGVPSLPPRGRDNHGDRIKKLLASWRHEANCRYLLHQHREADIYEDCSRDLEELHIEEPRDVIEYFGILLAEAEIECGHKHQTAFTKLSALRDEHAPATPAAPQPKEQVGEHRDE